MPISTNSIIHYTASLDNLKSILKVGFSIKYCSEELYIAGNRKSRAAHPMICFCDIPLSQAYEFMGTYGNYGVGLSKEWAKKNGINPVLYLEKDSSIVKTIGDLLAERREDESNLSEDQKDKILRIKCFTKNYSGQLNRGKTKQSNYKFYDEREWRFVPESKDLGGARFSIHLSTYQKDKDKWNSEVASLRFKFLPEDISYIIVNETSEIPTMIGYIKSVYNLCSEDVRHILFSKICSTEQIKCDY
jgi:hypothetical protein